MELKGFICEETDATYTLSFANSETLLSLKIKDWETGFLGKKFGLLKINPLLSKLGNVEVLAILDDLLLFVEENGFSLVELQCDMAIIAMIPFFEEKGFRLVDTRISFITLIEKPLSVTYPSAIDDIMFATIDDFAELVTLTHKSFTNNPTFFSRYKNRSYFTPEETQKYYEEWIKNHIKDKDTLFVVSKNNQRIVGYSFFKVQGSYKGEKLYKAVLTAVDSDFQGHKAHLSMQAFLFTQIPESRFYLDNTTQLTNTPAIKNSISSIKTLDNIGMVYYYRRHSDSALSLGVN